MGIRFRCHHCEQELHVKDFLGGKRGKCPKCNGSFRVPSADAPHSLPADVSASPVAAATESSNVELQDTHEPVSAIQDANSSRATAAPENSIPPAVPTPGRGIPPALSEAADDSTWYVQSPDGGQYGPATKAIFQEWLTEGRVTSDSLVWRDGWPEWRVAASVFNGYFATPVSTQANSGNPPTGVGVESRVATAPSVAAAKVTANASGETKILQRKRKRRGNYIVLLSILSVVFVVLVTALVYVLVFQPSE